MPSTALTMARTSDHYQPTTVKKSLAAQLQMKEWGIMASHSMDNGKPFNGEWLPIHGEHLKCKQSDLYGGIDFRPCYVHQQQQKFHLFISLLSLPT